MKALIILTAFLTLFSLPVISTERASFSWFSIFKIEEKAIEPSFFLKMAVDKVPLRDFLKEYSYDGKVGAHLETFPKHLVQYVLSRIELTPTSQAPKALKDKSDLLKLKSISSQSSYLRIPSSVFIVAFPLNFNFALKYKGIKKTKEERLPLPLNYHAREFEVVEGFEAGETLSSYFKLNPQWKIISRVGIFEKWETEKLEYEEAHQVEILPQQMFSKRFTGTLKYALGCMWDIEMQRERKMSMEFLMQQTTVNQWKIEEFLLSERNPSGILFDHWVMTITFDF
jgi:hypothetical protein